MPAASTAKFLVSFLILVNCALSLFSLSVLLEICLSYWSFLRTRLLFHWFFSIVFVFNCIDFCSYVFLFPSFCFLCVYFDIILLDSWSRTYITDLRRCLLSPQHLVHCLAQRKCSVNIALMKFVSFSAPHLLPSVLSSSFSWFLCQVPV